MGNLIDKYLLDLGCGVGENSVYFVKKGVWCLVIDYFLGMVDVVVNLVVKNSVKIEGKIMDVMVLEFFNNIFDFVYVFNLFYYLLDLKLVIREMYWVFKFGGKVCFWDLLKYNLVINVYWCIVIKVRIEDEIFLDINIIDFVKFFYF